MNSEDLYVLFARGFLAERTYEDMFAKDSGSIEGVSRAVSWIILQEGRKSKGHLLEPRNESSDEKYLQQSRPVREKQNAKREQRARNRSRLTRDETTIVRHQNATQHSRYRETMSEVKKVAIRTQNAERHAHTREGMSEAKKEAIRTQNAERHAKTRGVMSEAKQKTTRKHDAEKHAKTRAARPTLQHTVQEHRLVIQESTGRPRPEWLDLYEHDPLIAQARFWAWTGGEYLYSSSKVSDAPQTSSLVSALEEEIMTRKELAERVSSYNDAMFDVPTSQESM
jgi:hypothetical protein